jgi:hypothetical protein
VVLNLNDIPLGELTMAVVREVVNRVIPEEEQNPAPMATFQSSI